MFLRERLLIKLVWETTHSISLAALVISFTFALLNYLYTRKRTKVRGPEFVIPYVEIETPYAVKQDKEKTPYCTIIPLIQNIGDRMSYLLIQEIIMAIPVVMQAKGTDVVTFTVGSVLSLPEKMQFTPQHQVPKGFTIDFDPVLDHTVKAWKEAYLAILGVYTNQKGKMEVLAWGFKLERIANKKLFFSGQPFNLQKWSSETWSKISKNRLSLSDFSLKSIFEHDSQDVTQEIYARAFIDRRERNIKSNSKTR